MTLHVSAFPTPLIRRPDGLSLIEPELLAQCRSYREACRLAWHLRAIRGMTLRGVAEVAGLYAPHVTDYLGHDDAPTRRDLPGRHITTFQAAVGNVAIAQWLAMSSGLPLTID